MGSAQNKSVILAIDDTSINLVQIKAALSSYFDVKTAKSKEIALFMLDTAKVDLILLDIDMPGMVSFDFLRVLREQPGAEHIPILVLSSANNENIVGGWMSGQAGIIEYIAKPIRKEILKEKIFAMLNMSAPH